MTNTMPLTQRSASLGASRASDRVRPSMAWPIAQVASSLKPCTHGVTKAFGTNATYHLRPEEALL